MTLVQFNSVEKTFKSQAGQDFVAVRDFTVAINKGEFFCLLGPSGCGKTTVLGMLAGFEAPTSGQILFSGVSIRGPSRDRGVVFQGDDSLYPWLNAVDNIAFGLHMRGMPRAERRGRARTYLELVGMGGQHGKYPPELSGGMKQRIQIARALANEPRMLLMDEPFGALDAQTRGIMQRELRRIWQKTDTSVLFITHDIDEAITLGSRVGVMTAGPGGTIKDLIAIELDSERSRTDPKYIRYYERIYGLIRQEVEKATSQNEMEVA